LHWIEWCQEVAQVLTTLTEMEWRPRDVEMAVFTAEHKKNDVEYVAIISNQKQKYLRFFIL